MFQRNLGWIRNKRDLISSSTRQLLQNNMGLTIYLEGGYVTFFAVEIFFSDATEIIFSYFPAKCQSNYLEFDDSGQLSTKIYDKRDDFNFKIINFPNICSNIPASPAYGVYISQLIRYARASSNYSDFLKRHLHLRNRLLDQGY